MRMEGVITRRLIEKDEHRLITTGGTVDGADVDIGRGIFPTVSRRFHTAEIPSKNAAAFQRRESTAGNQQSAQKNSLSANW